MFEGSDLERMDKVLDWVRYMFSCGDLVGVEPLLCDFQNHFCLWKLCGQTEVNLLLGLSVEMNFQVMNI